MNEKSYQYILLDWDGNLARTLDVWLIACRAPVEKRGMVLSDKEIAECFGKPREKFIEWGVTDIDTALAEMHDKAAGLMPSVELYPDAVFTLEGIRSRNKAMALITSSRHIQLDQPLSNYGLRDYFDAIITGDETVKQKPDPESLEKALNQLGGTKDRAIMIGDSDKDVGAAKNLGIDSILFYPKSHEKYYSLENLKAMGPTYLIEDFKEVLDIVG